MLVISRDTAPRIPVLFLCLISLLSPQVEADCLKCDRKPGDLVQCMVAGSPGITPTPCPATDDRCVSIQVFHTGQKEDQGDKDTRFANRVELKDCFGDKRDKCAQDNFPNLRPEGNQCVKGDFPIEAFEKYTACTGDTLKVDRITGQDGKFWGEYGNVQYVEIKMCSCKATGTTPCNDHLQDALDKATVVTGAVGGGGGGSQSVHIHLSGFLSIFVGAIIIIPASFQLN